MLHKKKHCKVYDVTENCEHFNLINTFLFLFLELLPSILSSLLLLANLELPPSLLLFIFVSSTIIPLRFITHITT